MKQLLQDARTGAMQVAEVPVPKLLPGCVLVRIAASLVSAGTERAASAFASKNILQKAAARPDLVRDLLAKVRRDGVLSAWQVARSRLDQPLSLGYSSSGTVIEVAQNVTDIRPGDRVACAGAGHAVHAEFACVPRLLVAKIPESSPVHFDEAAFTTLGAVALHGIRTAEARLGDVVGVIGLGLLGQLTVQILKAAGCRVFGIDLVQERAELALKLGADGSASCPEEFADLCRQSTGSIGMDSVLITADTASSAPVNLAAQIARDRATVVAVGAVGMEIDRRLYYGKEIDFRISRSYGPGRYDSAYEQKGQDYPVGYVRWTENRNMEAFLQLVADGKLKLESLVTHRFPIEAASRVYDLIFAKPSEPSLGILLTYAAKNYASTIINTTAPARRSEKRSRVGLSFLGAGSFATSTLLPAMRRLDDVELLGVCAASGVHAKHAAERYHFQYCTTAEQQILDDPACDAVLIATRHHLHAQQVIAALQAGKHVFCEKPLCIREEDLTDIVAAYRKSESRPVLTTGFNRRFAPMVRQLKSFFSEVREPLALTYRINAGVLSPDHWVSDPEQGGGRVVGEICHFVDLSIFLTGSLPIKVYAQAMRDDGSYGGDNLAIVIACQNGSQATINYRANGDRAFSKERLEVFAGGRVAVLEDFRRLELVCHGRRQVVHSRLRQDKGHREELRCFLKAIRDGGQLPIALDEILASTLTTFRIQDAVARGTPVEIALSQFLEDLKPKVLSVPA